MHGWHMAIRTTQTSGMYTKTRTLVRLRRACNRMWNFSTVRKIEKSIERSTGRTNDRTSHQTIVRSIERTPKRPNDRTIERSSKRVMERPNDRPCDRATGRVSDRHIDLENEVLWVTQSQYAARFFIDTLNKPTSKPCTFPNTTLIGHAYLTLGFDSTFRKQIWYYEYYASQMRTHTYIHTKTFLIDIEHNANSHSMIADWELHQDHVC